MSGLGNGFVNLFKSWGRGIGNAADNFLLGADARKAISDEVISKFKPMIERAQRAESKKAANIKDLNDKLNTSKQDLQNAKNTWQQQYDNALANAKAKRQTDIANYDNELQTYRDAIANANRGKQDILDQLSQQEAIYNPTKTIYTDVTSGDRYIVDPVTGEYKNITQIYNSASKKKQKKILKHIKDFDERLLDINSETPKVINAFDKATRKSYRNNNIFDNYLNRVEASKSVDLRNADNQIKQAKDNLTTWNKNNTRPTDWDDVNDSKAFKTTYESTIGKLPNKYNFNGQTYSKKKDLDKAYKDALTYEQNRKNLYGTVASKYVSKRDKEIAKRIQDAKDIKKAKLALGGALGAGALYAGAKAMYGGDDTPDNTDNTNNIDNTDNTYTGEPDPDFNVEKEGQAILKDRQQIDTDFDPDKADAEAILAGAAYDKGVEDGNSIRSSDDLGNNIAATTGGHTMDDRLYELIKNMKDPYKADAVANYIYSRHGDDPEVRYLGWRGWLNKYYGDSLRSILGIDTSGYKGMHISGGL